MIRKQAKAQQFDFEDWSEAFQLLVDPSFAVRLTRLTAWASPGLLKVWYCSGFLIAQLFIPEGYQKLAGG